MQFSVNCNLLAGYRVVLAKHIYLSVSESKEEKNWCDFSALDFSLNNLKKESSLVGFFFLKPKAIKTFFSVTVSL